MYEGWRFKRFVNLDQEAAKTSSFGQSGLETELREPSPLSIGSYSDLGRVMC